MQPGSAVPSRPGAVASRGHSSSRGNGMEGLQCSSKPQTQQQHRYIHTLFVSHGLANQIWKWDIISLAMRENNRDCHYFCRFHTTSMFILTVCDYWIPGQSPGRLGIILEVAAVFLPLRKQCVGKLWPGKEQTRCSMLPSRHWTSPDLCVTDGCCCSWSQRSRLGGRV